MIVTQTVSGNESGSPIQVKSSTAADSQLKNYAKNTLCAVCEQLIVISEAPATTEFNA